MPWRQREVKGPAWLQPRLGNTRTATAAASIDRHDREGCGPRRVYAEDTELSVARARMFWLLARPLRLAAWFLRRERG